MVTARSFAKHAFRCGLYDGEDVFRAIDDVELIQLQLTEASELKRRLFQRAVWHDFTGRLIFRNVGLDPVRLVDEYDLFIAYMPIATEVAHIAAVEGWRDRCRTSICWIDELWASHVPRLKPFLPALRQFDHVVLGYHGTVDVLSTAMGRRCHFVPTAVDAIRFSPYPHPPPRVIDVYSLGRRREQQHEAIVNAAGELKMFYLFDTSTSSLTEVPDSQQHRELVANISKRSRLFVVAPTAVQVEVGLRYYEAAAAGAVMIGQAPDCAPFRRMFDWPDVVIRLEPDGSDVAEVLSKLIRQPERLKVWGQRNAREALLRHDWVYRWETILGIAGLSPGPRLFERKKRLRELADMANDKT
jgi:hypothetical protein